MTAKRVLSVGQCAMDHGSLGRLLHRVPADVVSADSVAEALTALCAEAFALVLVNRVFDVTAEGGLDFIRQVKGDEDLRETPIMLVSNFPEPQAEAEALGAIPGFGKAALAEPATLERLRELLS